MGVSTTSAAERVLLAKVSTEPSGLLAGFVEGLEIGAEGSDAQAGEVLGHVEPVRADVSHAAGGTTGFRGSTRQFQSVS